MELWIRSQDRECLMKVDRVDYSLSNIEHRIYVNGYETLVGHYATEERALEVLDEIQNILNPKLFVRANEDNEKVLLGALQKGVTQKLDMEFKELSTYVYKMPKE